MSGRAGAGASAQPRRAVFSTSARDRHHCHLALASRRPDCEVTAVDVMPDAGNAGVACAGRLGHRGGDKSGDWFSALDGRRFATDRQRPYHRRAGPRLAEAWRGD